MPLIHIDQFHGKVYAPSIMRLAPSKMSVYLSSTQLLRTYQSYSYSHHSPKKHTLPSTHTDRKVSPLESWRTTASSTLLDAHSTLVTKSQRHSSESCHISPLPPFCEGKLTICSNKSRAHTINPCKVYPFHRQTPCHLHHRRL